MSPTRISIQNYSSSFLTTFAGTPAIRLLGGTDRITTAPAATTLPAPIVTPGQINALVPIHTPSSTTMSLLTNAPHLQSGGPIS